MTTAVVGGGGWNWRVGASPTLPIARNVIDTHFEPSFDGPISVYRFPRRALTLCLQLCMGIQPGARFPARSADALPATLYGHFTQVMYQNRPIASFDVASKICQAVLEGSGDIEDMQGRIAVGPGAGSLSVSASSDGGDGDGSGRVRLEGRGLYSSNFHLNLSRV